VGPGRMRKAWLRKQGKKIALENRRARKARLAAGGGGEEEGQAERNRRIHGRKRARKEGEREMSEAEL
jgi:hypothetical protein